MRYTHPRPQRAETGISVCRFRAATLLRVGLACLVLFPIGSEGQTPPLTSPNDVLSIDPDAFAQWLETGRPTPVTVEEMSRILDSLPPSGEVRNLDGVQLKKLAAVKELLRATGRDEAYVVKVVDVPQAAIGLHARAVMLISEPALALLTADEVQALAAHEIGHEYVWDEYARAVRLEEQTRIKQLELLCDAIAVVILHRAGMDSSRLMSALDKIGRFNRDRFGPAVNEINYPTVAERRAFARSIRAWLARGRADRTRPERR
jgi:hypothetical protein